MKRRTAILFDNFGPYHLARLQEAANVCELLAIEFGTTSSEYSWNKIESNGLRRAVINEAGTAGELTARDFLIRLDHILSDFNPEVIFVPGWASRGALLSMLWGISHGIPLIVMSESTAWDERRNIFKEWIKKRVISFFSAGLVGGEAHQAYLIKLGMKVERVFMGYDVVDNNYFRQKAGEARSCSVDLRNALTLPQYYFLASARFIEKKNLPWLLMAYAKYRAIFASQIPSPKAAPWDLVLLGDGPLRDEIEALRAKLGLEERVHLPGFRQYAELPIYYALAGAIIHPSTTEPWGLVVNEAMASELPVLVSNRCGCTPELVEEGVNGWTFDPGDEEKLAALMIKISSERAIVIKMGEASSRIIDKWGPERFANGVLLAIETALSRSERRRSPTLGLFARILLFR